MNDRRSLLSSLARASAVGALVIAVASGGFARDAAAPPVHHTAAGQGETPSPPLVSTKGKANGAVLPPGRSTKLKVKVTDRSKRPLAGVGVLFIAPEAGAGGTFQNGASPDAITVTATTNANGIASAKFVANATPGPYLVSAIVDPEPGQDVPASLTFALTNGTAPAPALTAARARAAVHEQLLATATLDETLQLHGPVLVEAGTRVEAYGSADELFPSEPFTTARPSWLFWIDELPAAGFTHPTRFVVVDAADASPDLEAEARITREGWWPRLTPPGAEAPIDLLPAAKRAARGRPADPDASAPAPPRMPATDACAVVVCGPPEREIQNDAAKMVDFFRTGLRVPHVLNLGPGPDLPHVPARRAELFNFLLTASKMSPPCKKLYLYVIAHGNTKGFDLEPNSAGEAEVTYKELADAIEQMFRGKGTDICIILPGCHTAAAIGEFQNRGLTGTIVTGAGVNHASFIEPETLMNPTPESVFGRALRLAWRDVESDADGDGHITLREAFLGLDPDPLVFLAEPRMFPILPVNPIYPAPNVVAPKRTETVTVMMPRPPGVRSGSATLKLTMAAPATAVFVDGMGAEVAMLTVFIGSATQPVPVPVKGLVDGVTTYDATYEDERGVKYEGQATVRVGNGYGVIPNPIRLNVGETVMATLARGGVFEQVPHPTPILVRSANPAIAGPETTMLTYVAFQREGQFPVTGVTAGLTSLAIFDLVHGVTLTVPVEVVAEKCVFFEGRIPCRTGSRMDLCGHHQFIALNDFDLDVSMGEDGVVTLSGSNPQKCPASGRVDAGTCALTTEECRATVAGFPNVRNQWLNVVFSETTNKVTGERTITVTGQYAMGLGGELPGGCPIVYDFSGSATVAKRGAASGGRP